MKKLFIASLFLALTSFFSYADKHYTVVISLDGYRWDYPQWYDTPFMDLLASKGVEAGLIPSYPSKTFPNHYTIATGLYPDHHGIVANSFIDSTTGGYFSLDSVEQKTNPAYYGGEPIWNTAKRQGLKAAVFYWPGSDVCVGGSYPDTYYIYDKKPRLSMQERLDGIIKQLSLPESKRPDLVMGYLEEPDYSGHSYGPQDKRTRQSVEKVDMMLMDFYKKLQHLPIAKDINLIVLSDHGMTWVGKGNNIPIKHRLKSNWIKAIDGTIPANIYVQAGCQDSVYNALRGLQHAKVWRKTEIPARLHYGTNCRIGDIVVAPDLGYIISEKEATPSGAHGFDNGMSDMHALFRAIGPDFQHIKVEHFPNTNIYALLCRLLNIKEAENDGNIDSVSTILQ